MLRPHPRRSGLGSATVIVAVIALRISFISMVGMTIGTFHFSMDFIKEQSGNGVLEVRLVPTLVATDAH